VETNDELRVAATKLERKTWNRYAGSAAGHESR
jgi:hypothetical protein